MKRALMFEISKNDDPCDFSWLDECAQKLASISRDGYAVVLRDEAIVDGLKGRPRVFISFDHLRIAHAVGTCARRTLFAKTMSRDIVLREIDDAFEAESLSAKRQSPESVGERRGSFESYAAGVD